MPNGNGCIVVPLKETNTTTTTASSRHEDEDEDIEEEISETAALTLHWNACSLKLLLLLLPFKILSVFLKKKGGLSRKRDTCFMIRIIKILVHLFKKIL